MRICVLSDGYPPWERGGAQKIAAQLARGYADRGHDVSVVTTVPERSAVGSSTVDGVRVIRLYCPRWRSVLPYLTLHNPLVVGEVRRLLDGIDPSVVHAHNVHYLSNGSLRAAARVAPVAKTFHDAGTVAYGELTEFVDDVTADKPIPPESYRVDPWRQFRDEGVRYVPMRNPLNRRCIARDVDVGVSVSRALRQALVANGIECGEVVHNGVDITDVDGTPDEFRDAYGLGVDPFVLFGGRTSHNKGADHLASAFRRIASDLPDARLIVTGDDDYVSRMQDLAEPFGDRIVSTGWISRDELRGAFAAATVVATPSVFLDPFPTVNLEAFAAGTPVVTTRFGGATELVDDGEDGVVVDPTDVEALADALREFLESPRRAAAFGAAGRWKVSRRHTVDAQVDAYLDILGSLSDGNSRDSLQPTANRT